MADDNKPVGYGNPPKETQFKPGQSGNPRGRARGSKGLRAELKSELNELVEVTIDGRQRKISKRRLIIKSLTAKAAKGDVRAADKIISLLIQAEGFEDQRPQRRTLSDTDQQILNRITAMHADEPVEALGAVEAASRIETNADPDNITNQKD